MSNQEIPRRPTASELEQQADKLEAISGLLHGSAYGPVMRARRFLLLLAKQPTPGEGVEPGEFDGVIADLTKFANTVANPASTRMVDAATTLAQFQPAQL